MSTSYINIEDLGESSVNQVVLITGAAGSIGSEIVKSICRMNCKQVVVLDNSEQGLYELEQELFELHFKNFTIELCDVTSEKFIEKIFEKYNPDIVFHSAAYKQVPLLEEFPHQAFRTNFIATKNLIDFSLKFSVDKFLFISTDKAVYPKSVLGFTKRLAEQYLLRVTAQQGDVNFKIIRLGNVLGSRGSVVPKFKKQIKKGGPVTITHKDMTRYLMSISEASNLIISSAFISTDVPIFVLDMGEKQNILDFAIQMIEKDGLKYKNDVDVVFVGVRKGEKLEEELHYKEENQIFKTEQGIIGFESGFKFNNEFDNLLDALCFDYENMKKNELINDISNIIN